MNNEIAPYLLSDTRLPFLNTDNPPIQVLPPVYMPGMMFFGVEYPFG